MFSSYKIYLNLLTVWGKTFSWASRAISLKILFFFKTSGTWTSFGKFGFIIRPFQEIACERAYLCAKVFRHVINSMRKWNFWQHFFFFFFPVFDEDMWLRYTRFFSSVFFRFLLMLTRFLLMLTVYEKIFGLFGLRS